VRGGAGEAVPGADGEAVVAPVDAVAHQRAQFVRDRPGVLDRQVGDAAGGIEPVGCREGRRRAYVQATRTTAAAVRVRRVGQDVERGVDFAQEQPGAVLAGDQVGMLSLPAEPGAPGQRLLHHRRGIDEHLHAGAEARDHELREMLEHPLHEVVVVPPARVDRDIAATRVIERAERIAVRGIGQAERDHAARLRPQRARLRPLLGARRHPAHVAVLTGGKEGAKPVARFRAKFGPAKPDGVEAEGECLVADQSGWCHSPGHPSSLFAGRL